MSAPDHEKQLQDDHQWIQTVRSDGAVPFHDDPDQCLKSSAIGWGIPPANQFMVRGPRYLKTKTKIPAADCLLTPLGFDWIKSPIKISNLLANPNNRVTADAKPFLWAFNIQLPTAENHSIVSYFAGSRPPEGSLMGRFFNGDDVFRNSRLKMIVTCHKGPWIVRKAIGNQAITLIGKSLDCKYFKTQGSLEVDIDVGSSIAAMAVFQLAFGYFPTSAMDIAYVIEGRKESDLPELMLGAFRFANLDASLASQFPC